MIRIAQRMSEFVTFSGAARGTRRVIGAGTESQVTHNTFPVTIGDLGLAERVTPARAGRLPFVQVTTESVHGGSACKHGSGSWSRSPDWTVTTAEPRWWPVPYVTRAWK